MNDFDDLFGAPTSPSGAIRRGSSLSASGSPRSPRIISSNNGFGAPWDDGMSSNPFADLQSSGVAAFGDYDSAIAASADTISTLTSPHQNGLTSPGKTAATNDNSVASEALNISTRSSSLDAGAEADNDRVVVSPMASRTTSELDVRAVAADNATLPEAIMHGVAQARIAENADPQFLTRRSSVNSIDGYTQNDPHREPMESPWTEQDHRIQSQVPVLDIDQLGGFGEHDEPRPAHHHTTTIDEDNQPHANGSLDNGLITKRYLHAGDHHDDTGSIRTIGLESDVASVRSQPGMLIRPEPQSFTPNLEDEPSGRPSFVVTVGDPTKVSSTLSLGDPLTSHTVYTVRTRTSSTAFRKKDFSVLRRFRDFLWLVERLNENNPGVVVPPPPDKAVVGKVDLIRVSCNFSLTHRLGRFSQSFVESRRLALQSCLTHILQHHMLYTDPDLRLFLESDTFHTDIKHRSAAIQAASSPDASTSTASRFFSLSSLTSPRFVEFDDFFEARRSSTDAFETSIKALTASLATSIKLRGATAASSTELANALNAMSTCELSQPVKDAVNHLAQLQRMRAEAFDQLACEEEAVLLVTAEQYMRLIGSIRVCDILICILYCCRSDADNIRWHSRLA